MTVKALSGTKSTVNPMVVIDQLRPLYGKQKVIVAGAKKDGGKFQGELLGISDKFQAIEIFDDEEHDFIRFDNVGTIEHTNP